MKVYYSTNQDKLSQFLDSISIEHTKWSYSWGIYFLWSYRGTGKAIKSSDQDRLDWAKSNNPKIEFIDVSDKIKYNHLSKYKIKPTI